MSKYAHLATIKAQIKDLQEEAKLLEKEIFEEVVSMDGEKLETPYATFTVMYRAKWRYSDDLQLKEKQVKEKIAFMKKQEEANGTAEKLSDGGYLRTQVTR